MFMNKPSKLVVYDNMEENWHVFRREFEEYVSAAGLEDADDERLVSLLLNFAGADAYEVLDNSDLTAEEKKILEKVVQFFEDRFVIKTNETLLRFTFFSRSQRDGESFEEFYSALRKLAEGCKFDNQKSLLIRDQIVIGILDQNLREEFLRTPHLPLEDAVERCGISEAAIEPATKWAGAEADKIADAKNFTDDAWMAAHTDVRSDFRMKKTPEEFNRGQERFQMK